MSDSNDITAAEPARQAKSEPSAPARSEAGGGAKPSGPKRVALANVAQQPPPAVRAKKNVANPNAKTPQTQQVAPFGPPQWALQASQFDLVGIEKKRRFGFLIKMLVFVGIPTLFATLYVYVYASPRYVAEVQISYQSANPAMMAASSSVLTSFLGASSTPNMTAIIDTYLNSADLLQKIDAKLHLREYYSQSKIDWWDRLAKNAPLEKFLAYFSHRLYVTEQSGGYDIVDVQAFDPQHAQTIAAALVEATDQMVTETFNRPRLQAYQFAEAEVNRTMERLSRVVYKVTKFQNDHHELDVTIAAGHLDAVISALQAQLSETRAQLIRDETFLQDNSPTIIAIKAKINALTEQIRSEQVRVASGQATTPFAGVVTAAQIATGPLVGAAAGTNAPRNAQKQEPDSGAKGLGPKSASATTAPSSADAGAGKESDTGGSYSNVVAEFAALQEELKFAESSYVSAKAAFELARAQVTLKQDYILSFVRPVLPQYAVAPDPTEYILGTFLLSILTFGAGSVFWSAFRDRAGM